MMRHDKRDADGTYRCCTPAEERAQRARLETQTHYGRFTHERIEEDRRMRVEVAVPQSAPLFKNKRFNRDSHKPAVTKG